VLYDRAQRRLHTRDMSRLEAIGGDVEGALERVNVPAYVIDASGVIRWLSAVGVHSRLEAVALARRRER
jgi:hypothetical protein